MQLVSTDISEVEDNSNLSALPSSQISILDQGILDSPDMEAEAAGQALRDKEERVRDMCLDLDPDLITVGTAPHMKEELQAINEARNEYRSAIRKFIKDNSNSLLSSEKAQWEADMQSVVN